MPFTVSHTAIVIPFKKLKPQWFSLTGLMAGAMAPDLQYFLLADTTYRGTSHSWPGLFTVCLPLGLIFAYAFHRLFKKTFIEHFPRPLDCALSGLAVSEFRPSGRREWTVLIASVLLGSLSHFFWDSFTHIYGVLAQRIPWLLEQSTFFGIARHNARWVQHVSSLLGILGLFLGLWRWKLVPAPVSTVRVRTARQKMIFWLIGSICGLVFAVTAVLFYNAVFGWQLQRGLAVGLAFQSFGLGSWAGFFYFVCLWGLVQRHRP